MVIKVVFFVFFLGIVKAAELDVCGECKTLRPRVYKCVRQGLSVLIIDRCEIRRLETAKEMFVLDLQIETRNMRPTFVKLARSNLTCSDFRDWSGTVELNGRLCEKTTRSTKTSSTTTTTTTRIPFPWPFYEPEDEYENENASVSTSTTTQTCTTPSTVTTIGVTQTSQGETVGPIQISFRASVLTGYWVLTVSVVIVVGAIGIGILIRCLRRPRRNRQPVSRIEVEELGPQTWEAAPLSPRRRKAGTASSSFESVELFSMDKRD